MAAQTSTHATLSADSSVAGLQGSSVEKCMRCQAGGVGGFQWRDIMPFPGLFLGFVLVDFFFFSFRKLSSWPGSWQHLIIQ